MRDLNESDYDSFLSTLQRLFEGEVLGKMLFESRPYKSYEDLIAASERAAQGLRESDRIRLINSHPRLGESAEALNRFSRQSLVEQGLDRDEPEGEREARQKLGQRNLDYEEKFGFRFVVFVNRRPPSELLAVLESRISRDRSEEIDEATSAVFLIARDRLGKLRITDE